MRRAILDMDTLSFLGVIKKFYQKKFREVSFV